MSDPGVNPPNPQVPPPPPPAQTTAGPSAEDLRRLDEWQRANAARLQEEARQAAANEIAQRLGCTVEEAEARLKAANDAQAAGLTEAEQRLAEAQALFTQATAADQAARQVILDTLKADALMDLGMSRTQARASVNLVQTPPEVTIDSVVAAANDVKNLFPALFGSPTGGGGTTGPVDTVTRGITPPGNPTPSSRDRAMERLYQYHPELKRKEAS